MRLIRALRHLPLLFCLIFSGFALGQTAPPNVTTILPRIPFNPGSFDATGNPISQTYRDAIARSEAAKFVNSAGTTFTLTVIFSDKAEQTWTVTVSPEGVYTVTVVPNSFKPAPPPGTFVASDCVSGAAQANFPYSGLGIPIYRATYLCSGNTCVLVNAVVVGFLGGGSGNSLPTYDAIQNAGDYCQAETNV